MVSASQIKSELAFYLAGVLSLEDFEDWFVLKSWNVSKSGSKAAELVTFEIEAMLSDYSSGYFSETRLREKLNDVLHSGTKVAEVRLNVAHQINQNPTFSFSTSKASQALRVRLSAVSV